MNASDKYHQGRIILTTFLNFLVVEGRGSEPKGKEQCLATEMLTGEPT